MFFFSRMHEESEHLSSKGSMYKLLLMYKETSSNDISTTKSCKLKLKYSEKFYCVNPCSCFSV